MRCVFFEEPRYHDVFASDLGIKKPKPQKPKTLRKMCGKKHGFWTLPNGSFALTNLQTDLPTRWQGFELAQRLDISQDVWPGWLLQFLGHANC